MKIAVLISGEYRKFDVARKTMSFLDDPNIDIYVSTWDKTVYSSPKINLYAEEDVTEERILIDLGRPATIRIDDHNYLRDSKYNSKMIDRWITGFRLIKSSGIKYDYVMVMRTDLFFSESCSIQFNDIEKYKSTIGFAWANSLQLRKLPDLIFISSFSNMEILFNSLTLKNWNDDNEDDWHIWWYSFIRDLSFDIIDLPELSRMTFCRYWMDQSHNFFNAMDMHHDWRDLRILHECDQWGDSIAEKSWPPHILIEAREKWNNGYFKKYYPKAVIFDLDGVLVSTDIIHYQSIIMATRHILGNDCSSLIDKKSMLSTKEKIKILQEHYKFSDIEYDKILEWKDKFFHARINSLKINENVIGCLDFLKRRNVILAIASNSRLSNINRVLDITGIKKYFNVIVSAEEVPNRKPAPDILFEVYKRLGIDGSKTLFVEDSDDGVAAGLKSLSKVVKINNPIELNVNLFEDWLDNVY